MQYAIGERVDITINREETGFDKACDAAYWQALMMFGADDDGHLRNVIDSERSRDSVMLEFVNYTHGGSMGGHSHLYFFKAWVDRAEDEDDDE